MVRESIPDDVRRFILSNVASVPHLEAILLLRNEPKRSWDAAQVAKRLYLNEKVAEQLLADLCIVNIAARSKTSAMAYRYEPGSTELHTSIDQMAAVYTKNLIEVTELVHSNTKLRVQQFADAFKLRKDD